MSQATQDNYARPMNGGLALVRRLIPSPRVFRRERFDGLHYHLRYGRWQIRLRPSFTA